MARAEESTIMPALRDRHRELVERSEEAARFVAFARVWAHEAAESAREARERAADRLAQLAGQRERAR
jgi:hypothetical protein